MAQNEYKFDQVLEGYKPIPMKKLYYPRGMKLSSEFINAFHREYDRLVDEGVNPTNLLQRFNKAMQFHVGEERRYRQLDETAPGTPESHGLTHPGKSCEEAHPDKSHEEWSKGARKVPGPNDKSKASTEHKKKHK